MDTAKFDEDPAEIYLRLVRAVPQLSPAQEIELCRHVLANDQEAESSGKTLVEANLAMVVSIAERYPGANINFLDLLIHGNDGLLLALKTFPDHSSQSFSAWAKACVVTAIERAIGAAG